MGRFKSLRSAISYYSVSLPITKVTFEKSPVDGVPVFGDTLEDGGTAVSSIENYIIQATVEVMKPKEMIIGRAGSTITQELFVATLENIDLIDTVNDQIIDFYCTYDNSYYRLMEYTNRQFGNHFIYNFKLVRIKPDYLVAL